MSDDQALEVAASTTTSTRNAGPLDGITPATVAARRAEAAEHVADPKVGVARRDAGEVALAHGLGAGPAEESRRVVRTTYAALLRSAGHSADSVLDLLEGLNADRFVTTAGTIDVDRLTQIAKLSPPPPGQVTR